MNLTERLRDNAERLGAHPALVDGDRTLSYAQLWALVESFGRQLHHAGIRAGDTVGLHVANSAAYVALTYAIWRQEARVVPIGTDLKPREVREIVEAMGISFLAAQAPGPGASRHVDHATDLAFCLSRTGQPPGTAGREMHIAFIRFTSGTTGTSKGVVLTHESIADRIDRANEALHIGPGDRILWVLSMAHHFVVTIILYLSYGATIVLVHDHLAAPMLAAAARHEVTILYAAAFHFALLARDKSAVRLPALRLALSTTTACPAEVAHDFRARFDLPLRQAYGIIEVGLACINFEAPDEKAGSVGKPMPGFQVKLDQTARYSTAGQTRGEVLITGPGMFDAYYNPWVTRADALRDGYFATGDIGFLDEEGALHLCGRTKDVINIAGLKVFPQEIEAVLNRHPRVRESRVFARAHPRLGELIEADVVLADDTGDTSTRFLLDYCKNEMAAYKMPLAFHVVPHLDKTYTGKIKRTISS